MSPTRGRDESIWLPAPVRRAGRAAAISLVRLTAAPSDGFEPGTVTVVTVNWNSLRFLRVCLDAVRRHSPPDLRILVVDNNSRDGSRAYLRARSDVSRLLLPINLRHGPALDIGFLRSRSEFVVALDVDAFPLRPDWLDRLLEPLSHGYRVSGVCSYRREFAHPSCLAMRRRDFVKARHSFRARWTTDRSRLGGAAWDTGELISMRERGRVHLIRPTSVRGPGMIGTVFGDVVYHNFYATRPPKPGRDIPGIEHSDAMRAWDEATEAYLGLGPSPSPVSG
jgi:glycosyltransferase involved in cell wall biosynthesis